jgi:anti-sigma-K factor RskA
MNGNGPQTVNGDVHALIAPYVLDAVDDIERAAFDRHLRECESCRAEVVELRAAGARLSDGVATSPPAELKDRVLETARQTRQAPPGDAPLPLRREPPATRTWRRAALASVAAAVVAIAAAVTTFTVMNRQLDEERDVAASVAAVLAAPDADVNTADVTGGGRASVVVSDSRGEAVVVLDGLPDLEEDQAYQLWYLDPDEIRSAGVVGSTVDTTPVLLTEVGDAQQIALSVEPEGGSDQPTTTPITAVDIQ